jgi:putative transposase
VICEKSALAELLWSRTTVTQEWLAEKLQMRRSANVSQLLRRAVVQRRNRQVPSRLADFINRNPSSQSENEDVSRFAH